MEQETSAPLRLFSRLLIPAVCLLIFLPLLQNQSPFDYRHDWNIPLTNAALRSMWHGPDGLTFWNPDQFGSVPFYPTLAPYLGLLSLLASFALQTGAVERIVLCIVFFGAAYAMRSFLRRSGASPLGAAIGAAAYVTTAYLFTEIGKGVLQGAISYAGMPLAATFFLRSNVKNGWNLDRFALLAGLIWGLTAVQIQYFVLDGILLAVLALATGRLAALVQAYVAVFLTDAYFLLPLTRELGIIHAALSEQSPTAFIYSISPSFWQAIRLTGCSCAFPEQAASLQGISSLWVFAGYLWACAAIVLAVLARARAAVVSLAIFVGAAILMAGTSVLGPLYPIIVEKVPGLYAFRESLNFGALAAFGAAGCFGFGVSALPAAPRRLRTAAWTVLSAVMVAYALPFLLNGLSTQLNAVAVPDSSSIADGYLRAHKDDARAMYIPFLVPMQPDGSAYTGIEPFISWGPHASFGNYVDSQFSRLVAGSLYHSDTSDFPTYARLGNIKYVDVRDWLTGRFVNATDAQNTDDRDLFTKEAALQSLSRANAVLTADYGQDRVYTLPYSEQNAAYGGDALMVVSGDFSALRVSSHLTPVSALSSQQTTQGLSSLLSRSRYLVIENGDDFELVVGLLPRQYMQAPGHFAQSKNANVDWGNTRFWDDWWWFRQAFIDTPWDIAISASQAHGNLRVSGFPETLGAAELWIKAFVGPTQGRLIITDPNGVQHVVITAAAYRAGYRWFHVADPVLRNQSSATVTLRSITGENAVASVLLAPRRAIDRARATAAGALRAHRVIQILTQPSAQFPVVLSHAAGRIRVFAAARFPASGSVNVAIGTKTYTVPVRKGAEAADLAIPIRAGSLTASFAAAPALAVAGIALLTDVPASQKMPLTASGDARYRDLMPAAAVVEVAQNYAPGWSSSSLGDMHFVANGYANGWVLGTSGTRVLYYERRLAITGRVLSGTFIVLLLAFLVLKRGQP